MSRIDRRSFIQAAALLGASPAWAGPAKPPKTDWKERRDLFPEGVASGDPAPDSVILWTRRPFDAGDRRLLTVEVALDPDFKRIVATAPAAVNAAADWTCRVLVGNLKPAKTYWYRFTDELGAGSRIGRTRTAPAANDPAPVNFAFVSCQDLNEGRLNAFRRMIFEDERAAPADQLGFVLHLGDFIYEVVQYTDEVKTRYDRTIYDVGRIPDGRKVGNFHIPVTLEGFRGIYRAYLADADLQDARARWPFVAIWDNHEFSWLGWQSLLKTPRFEEPGQSIKVAANQAWFEYLPGRAAAPSGTLERFDPPAVANVKIDKFDENGLGLEPNNLIAINSLIAYRSLRYGRHLDLIVTDQRSFRSGDPFEDPRLGEFGDAEFGPMYPEKIIQIVEGGRAYDGGKPPAELTLGGETRIPNKSTDAPPQTLLGATQKAWFKDKLGRSTATWKIWGNSMGVLTQRADPQNLPPGTIKAKWPQGTYASLAQGDYGAAYIERGEICDFVRDNQITGFAVVSGDLHSFWAGYISSQLPPDRFEPVGLAFTGGSLISPGAMESYEHNLKKDNPLRHLFLADRPGAELKPQRPHAWTFNMLLRHGVRACLEYAKSFDLTRARALSNPDLAPHLEFVDMGGHGYAKVRLSADQMRTEFVCIPRPVTRSERPDGGPLSYRVAHTAKLWAAGERPNMRTEVLEGDVGLSI